jgi:ribonuclease D
MNISQVKNNNISVQLVDTEASLKEVAEKLNGLSEFAFDTEFDRFRWEYGFTLLLLQIFDGQTCYLIDPIQLKNLSSLWTSFQNPAILKVLYSGKEDIDLIKRYGCKPKNIFDVQIASRISNHPAVSFSKLVLAELGIELDKSEQTSNWKQRPLAFSQQHYASNDVIHLLRLKDRFLAEVTEIGMLGILQEENLAIEHSTTPDFAPKLSDKQKAVYSEHHKEILLKLFVVRDEKGKELNVPPFKVVSDEVLEDIIKNPELFMKRPNIKGFSKRALENGKFLDQILTIVNQIKRDLDWNSLPRMKSDETIAAQRRERFELDALFKSIKQQVVAKYGPVAGEFYMLGTREAICSKEMDLSVLKTYQQEMIKEAIEQLNKSIPV